MDNRIYQTTTRAMNPGTSRLRLLAVATVILCSTLSTGKALAHGGGLDANGGHTDKRTGQYHCHSDKCHAGATEPAPTAISAASSTDITSPEKRPIPPYNRPDWPHWTDEDSDCQDTRAETLISASQVPVKFKRNKGCVVSWGGFYDPYTDATFEKASDLDIDHLVPLEDAHRSGGHSWPRSRRRAFANDPDNLIAVDLSANRSKGSRAPYEWMPDNVAYHCEYLTRWIQVKTKYGLTIHPDTHEMQVDACTKYLKP